MNLVRLPAEFFANLDAPVLLDIHGDTVLDVRRLDSAYLDARRPGS